MKLKNVFAYIVVTCMTFALIGGVEYRAACAAGVDDPGDIVTNPWGDNSGSTPTIPDLSLDSEATTAVTPDKPTVFTPEKSTTGVSEKSTVITSENPTENSWNKKLKTFRKTGKVKVKTVSKKQSAPKVKITLKKTIKEADGYVIRFYNTKKSAKKNKKVLAKVTYKKNKKVLTVKHTNLKNRKNLFVRVRGYVKINAKTYYSKKWSVTKKVRIKK